MKTHATKDANHVNFEILKCPKRCEIANSSLLGVFKMVVYYVWVVPAFSYICIQEKILTLDIVKENITPHRASVYI